MSGDAATQLNYSSSFRERYRAIPDELRCLKQWGLHKNRRRMVIRDGELVSTDCYYLPDWMSFDDAVRALESYPGAADGLVFYLCPEIFDDIPQVVALEFDCCRDPDTGEIIPWAREMIERIQPFYTEISASGTGIVAFVMVRVSHKCAAVFSIDNIGPVDTSHVKSIAKAKAIPANKVRPSLNICTKMSSVRVTGNKIEDLCYAVGDRRGFLFTYIFSSSSGFDCLFGTFDTRFSRFVLVLPLFFVFTLIASARIKLCWPFSGCRAGRGYKRSR